MCRQFVPIGACRHHRFSGLFEKCIKAISNKGICSGAIHANDLIDRVHIILDEHVNLCEPCEFFYNQGLSLAKSAIDLQGHEFLEDKRQAEEAGKRMRADELTLLQSKEARKMEKARIEAEEEAKRLAKREGKVAVQGGTRALSSVKELLREVKLEPSVKNDRLPTKRKAGHVARNVDHAGDLHKLGPNVQEAGESEIIDARFV